MRSAPFAEFDGRSRGGPESVPSPHRSGERVRVRGSLLPSATTPHPSPLPARRGERGLTRPQRLIPLSARASLSLLVLLTLTLVSLPASAQTFDDVRVYASAGKSVTTWHGQADLQGMTVELGRALSPRTTVAVAATPMTLWQPRSWFGDQFGDGNESVHALHAALLIRRTFRPQSRLQWYVEGATGPMISEKRVPASTSRFNFITHGGGGIVLNAQGRVAIIAGYRFMHISNGGYSPRNPGLNVSAAVLGVQLRSATRRRD